MYTYACTHEHTHTHMHGGGEGDALIEMVIMVGDFF